MKAINKKHTINLAPLTVFMQKHKEIAAAYLFGSSATGRNKENSDVDIAFVTKNPIEQLTRIAWETRLSNLLHRDIDLVIFGQASPLLKHQILKYGQLIEEPCPKYRIQQETIARYEYLDTQRLFKELRLANG